MSEKLTLRFVVHTGRLETQAIILATSLRYFNRDQVHIQACIPQNIDPLLSGISDTTKTLLSELDIEMIPINNPIDPNYLIGNKFECLAGLNGPRMFLDTDIICCSPLHQLQLKENNIYLKPADRKTYSWKHVDWINANACVTGETDYPHEKILSTCFNELMHPYYNAGLIAINGCSEFTEHWVSAAKSIDQESKLKGKRPWLDQLSLPIAIKKAGLNTNHLSELYNFPANIKPISRGNELKLTHYHRPDVVARNPVLIDILNQVSADFPCVMDTLKNDVEWQDVYQLMVQTDSPRSGSDYIITGIPRSGTSYCCLTLSKHPNMVVINEPSEVTKPLKRRNIPWGIATYYQNTKKEIALNRPIMNKHNKGLIIEDTLVKNERTPYLTELVEGDYFLATKNTLAYLTGIARVMHVMPHAKIIACFRNPVDTIASWNNSFDHLKTAKPLDINVIKMNSQWMNDDEITQLHNIQKAPCNIYRQAMLWNFFAQQLLKHRNRIQLIGYEDMVLNPTGLLTNIMKPSPPEIQCSKVKSKRSLLTDDNIRKITSLTKQCYVELMSQRVQLGIKSYNHMT